MSDEHEWVTLRVLVVNTHVGLLLMNAVRWLLQRERYHIVMLQECGRPMARARLRLVFSPLKWKLVGVVPPSLGPGSSGTIIATRRERIRYVDSSNRLITKFLNRMHPTRRLTVGHYVDKRTRHELQISSMHTWHIVGASKGGMIEATHDRQLDLYGLSAREGHKMLRLCMYGGDVNETRARGKAAQVMRDAHMREVVYDGLDGLWVSDAVDCRTVSVDLIPLVRFKGGEKSHDALSVTLQLRKLNGQPVDSDL